MIQNLGKVMTILLMQEVREASYAADLAAFHAPSECYRDVERGAVRERRRTRRHAEAVAGAPLRIIRREAWRRGQLQIGAGPVFDRAFGRMYTRHGFPG